MLETRNERILRIKKEKQSQKVQMMNQSLKKSLIVVGTTACVGLYVSPVDQLLSANFSVVLNFYVILFLQLKMLREEKIFILLL